MARQTIVHLTDDIDGTAADETLTFALDSRQWEIDLSEKNADKLRKALAPFMEHARRARNVNSLTPRRGRRSANSDVDPKAVRAWARSQGIEVSARGRIPSELIEQFRASGN